MGSVVTSDQCPSSPGLVRRAERQSPAIDNFAEVAYYDESDPARWITQKAVFLQQDYMNYPALVHIETLVSRRITGAPCDRCTYLSSQARVQTTGDDGRRLPADYANCPHLMCRHISVTTQSAISSSLR